MFNFFTDLTPTVPISFRVGTHVDPATGEPPRFVHHLERVDGEDSAPRVRAYGERINAAGKGVKDKAERARLQRAVLYDIWVELLGGEGRGFRGRVEGYGPEVDALPPEELARYFRGEVLPDGVELDEEALESIRDQMAVHVAEAVRLWFDRMTPEPSFRR